MSTLFKFAESDNDVRELMREARGLSAADLLPLQRRSFLKLAGASGAGLVGEASGSSGTVPERTEV